MASKRRRTVKRTRATPIGNPMQPKPSKPNADFEGYGEGPVVVCPVCDARVTTRGPFNKTVRTKNPDALFYSSHRIGGGKVSNKRGDIPCRMSGEEIK